MLMGLGLVFFGMSVMSDAMKPLRSYQPFLDLMVQMENPLVGILISAAFTGLVQSSSATTGIVIVMASQGFISLPAGIALAFGANIGTCVTAMLATIGKTREAVRAAVVHVLFNVAGVLLWVFFIDHLAELVAWFSPAHPELTGAERLAAETPRQIANAHTIFNLANTLIFIWFTTQIARLVEVLLPDKPLEEKDMLVRNKYLVEELLTTPSLALDRVRLEVLHMGEHVQDMLSGIMPAILAGDREALAKIHQFDDRVDMLYADIIGYMGKISKQSLNEKQTSEFLGLMEAVGNLENIGDLIETNMVELGYDRINTGVAISDSTREIMQGFHKLVSKGYDGAVQAVSQNNVEAARAAMALSDQINEMSDSAAAHLAERLVADEPNRIAAYTIEIDILEKQTRIYYFAKRMARTVALLAGEESAAD
jgi:phosphate:Na+ symporter